MRAPRRVVITGASSGIGAALAQLYAARGATVALIARRRDRLENVAATLPLPAAVYALDVRDGAALAHAASDFIARHGPPDVVIASAGVSVGTLTERAEDLAAFQEVIDTNVTGMANTFQPFVSAMRGRGGGTLAGIASVAGIRGLPGASAYSASKAAAIAYLESLRVELRASGVKVITICPGFVATPMTAGNPYRMPFLMTADEAAQKIAAIIGRGRPFAVIPWQMALAARMLKLMPRRLYDILSANAPRKPRRG
ncbi:MAG: SDR family oxidoreductase [Betaproteobacteria bacterium]|nr:SDR family oxidoreductase [Betaproteobacteria bacterium]